MVEGERHGVQSSFFFDFSPFLSVSFVVVGGAGACDANIHGGPAKYRDAFLRPEYLQRHPEKRGQVEELKQSLRRHLEILESGLQCSRAFLSEEMAPFQENMDGCCVFSLPPARD